MALSRALFKIDLPVPEFPVLKTLRVLGISDSSTYSATLEKHFTYTNTFLHRRPVLDLTDPPADELGMGVHGGTDETSLMLHLAPHLVNFPLQTHRRLQISASAFRAKSSKG